MNIGMICYPTYGGSGVVASELGLALAQREHHVHFISYGMPFRLSGGFHENIFYHEVTASNYPLFEHPLYTASLSARAASLVVSEKLDILHAHYAIPHGLAAYIAREMAGAESKVKVVTTLHGTDITLVGRSPAFAPLVKFALERSDAVTAVSQWLRDTTYKNFPVNCPIEVIYNFVDSDRFQRLPGPCPCARYRSGQDRVLLHISNFRPVKRIEDVIRVYDTVQKQIPAILLMIGDGPEMDMAVRRVRELGLGERVHFLGKQNGIENYLSGADLFLMPSDHEAFGLAALEAMACETPVIGARAGGLMEVVEDGVCGALEPLGDTEAMAQRALEILKNPPLHQRMAKAARRRAIKLFNPETMVRQYEELYERTKAIRRLPSRGK